MSSSCGKYVSEMLKWVDYPVCVVTSCQLHKKRKGGRSKFKRCNLELYITVPHKCTLHSHTNPEKNYISQGLYVIFYFFTRGEKKTMAICHMLQV